MQAPEGILQAQGLLEGQQARLEAMLAGAWLAPNQVKVLCHAVPVTP